MFGILLLSVIAVTAYLGPMILYRFGPGQRLYAAMLIADLVVAGLAFWSLKAEGPTSVNRLMGVVAIGAALCLVMVPMLVRDLARRALVRDRFRLARLLVDVREILQPGMGAAQERELIDAIIAVREGRVDLAIELLVERRAETSEPAARRQLDERIAMTYLYARRWGDAIAHFEASFSPSRGGATPQLLVEMVRAYCEEGDFDTAADLVARLEAAIGGEEPLLAFLVHRARLVFLAFLGRTGAVEAIVEPTGPLGAMPESARAFWSGVARHNAGDRSGARSALEHAARLARTDSRAREVAETALVEVDRAESPRPPSVPPHVAELADRLTSAAVRAKAGPRRTAAPPMRGVSWRHIPVTSALIAVNVLAAAAVWWAFRSTADVGGLARAGGNVKSAVAHGEWWRLASSMFLHAGVLHLLLNMYGLWILGKLVEQFYGPVRFFCVYVVAGLCGSLASYVFGGPAMSVGASGAVFGLLGAATVELSLHRDAYPRRWRRALLGNLLFLIVANVAIGFEGTIDQAAHTGGLLAGGVAAVPLSPRARIAGSRLLRAAVVGLAIGCAGFLAYGAVGVATTSYAETIDKYPRVWQEVGGLRVRVPSAWRSRSASDLQDASMIATLYLERRAAGPSLDRALAERVERELSGGAREVGFDKAKMAEAPAVQVPRPWQVRELAVTADTFAGTIHYRAAVFGRRAGDELWLGTLFYPEVLADDIEPAVADALESASPVR